MKPYFSKFTESVVGELSLRFVEAEEQINAEKDTNQTLQKEVQTLKRKQESLISTCDDKSIKLKRLRSSEHHNLKKVKHQEKQTIVQPDASSSHASSSLTDKERKEYQRLTNILVEVENENEKLNERLEELESEKVEIFDYSTNQFKENV